MNVQAELEAIRRKHRGRLSPAIVLNEAADPEHPLHDRFEWDDAIAAHQHRLDQARALIVSVRVGYKDADGQPQSARWFHAVRASDEQQFDYLPADEVLTDPVLRKILFREMERQVAELVARYQHMQEFWELLKKQQKRPRKSA